MRSPAESISWVSPLFQQQDEEDGDEARQVYAVEGSSAPDADGERLELAYPGEVEDVGPDNVEKDEIIRPRRWNINFMFKFSGILGAISAAFDALLIILLLSVFRVADIALFRSALFLEIVLSEILVLFMIRSDIFVLRAEPPSRKLVVVALFGVFYGYKRGGRVGSEEGVLQRLSAAALPLRGDIPDRASILAPSYLRSDSSD